jgi:Glycosyl hydrolase family 1
LVFDAKIAFILIGTSDFFGLNHYTTDLAEYGVMTGDYTSYDKDQDVFKSVDPAWPGSAANWLKVVIHLRVF